MSYPAKFVSFRLPGDEREHFVISDSIISHVGAVSSIGYSLHPDADVPFEVLGAGSVSIGVFEGYFEFNAYGHSTSLEAKKHKHEARLADTNLMTNANDDGGLRYLVVDTDLCFNVLFFSNSFTDAELEMISSNKEVVAKGRVKLSADSQEKISFESFSIDHHSDYSPEKLKSVIQRTLMPYG